MEMNANNANIDAKVQTTLFQYRLMPPSQMLFGRQIHSRLHLLKPLPQTTDAVNDHKKFRKLSIGIRFQCRNYVGSNKWLFGRIKKRLTT